MKSSCSLPRFSQKPNQSWNTLGLLQATQSTPSIQQSPSPPSHNALFLPKNRSTGNLLAEAVKPAEGMRIRFSFDAGTSQDQDPLARPPIMPEHEHGLGVSGLRRIRQQPPSRTPTLPSSPEASFTSASRSSSMTINMPSTRTFTPGGPASPTLNFSEDLSRFPSESLHSFSFAHQSEDVLHNRQNMLKRSIDYMRDRLGWAANHPGLVNAQAKVNGDVEIQSMMELLSQAKLLGNININNDMDTVHSLQSLNGPLTGPANFHAGNVFDRNFVPRSESPDHLDDRPSTGPQTNDVSSDKSLALGTSLSTPKVDLNQPSSLDSSESQSSSVLAARRAMKRTYTDTSSLSLQSKLMDALAKPYVSVDKGLDNRLLSPGIGPTLGKLGDGGKHKLSATYGHAHRWAPAAQAIFTTEAHAPWTILAANDLACLVFGVTMAEVRKLGILEVVREDRRKWLEERLGSPGSEAVAKAKSRRSSPTSSTSIAVKGGITAMLLSKPPARIANRRAQTDDGSGSSLGQKNPKGNPNHPGNKSRGVLLCGDVIPIQKRNGATGSASLWVKEKRGGLIWVLEEIVEDIAYLTLDTKGQVSNAMGASEQIWAESNNVGKNVRKLIPHIPQGPSMAVDYAAIKKCRHFTARTSDGFNVPTLVTAKPEIRELRVSSFPHIAGILVLSADSLKITGSNSVFSTALFGHPDPDGLSITQLIPRFDRILKFLIEEDEVRLVDGIVIPEHSFRRARALLALRDGSAADAAAIFLRPTGLVAKHRDGSDINVDVQMRVVKSESTISDETVIEETSEVINELDGQSRTSEVVYALWITYSRHLHSVIRPGGPTSPLISRPGTPPRQPSPGQYNHITLQNIDSDDPKSPITPMSLLTQQIQEATSQPISEKPIGELFQELSIKPKPMLAVIKEPPPPKKKTISDFAILEEMGQGTYGQVKLARFKKNPSKKAVLKYVTKKRILVDTWYRVRVECLLSVEL